MEATKAALEHSDPETVTPRELADAIESRRRAREHGLVVGMPLQVGDKVPPGES